VDWIRHLHSIISTTAEEGFANLEVFDFTFGTESCAEACVSIVMFWGHNDSNKIMINDDLVKVRYLLIDTHVVFLI
jgi:hypothetical protein